MNLFKYGFIISMINILCFCVNSMANTDSLECVIYTLNKQGPSLELMHAYRNFGLYYFKKYKYDLSLEEYKNALEVAQVLKHDFFIARNKYSVGVLLDRLEKYEDAIAVFQETASLAYEMDSIELMFKTLASLTDSYRYAFRYIEAHKNQLKIYELLQEYPDSIALATMYQTNFKIFRYQKDYKNAFIQFNKAIDIYKKKNMEYDVALMLTELGTIHKKQKKYIKALDYYQQSLDLFCTLDNSTRLCTALHNVGCVYYNLKMYDTALDYLYASLDMALTTVTIPEYIANTKCVIGYVLLKQGKVDESIKILNEAIEVCPHIAYYVHSSKIYKFLAKAYAEKKDFAKAYSFEQKYVAVCDSLYMKEVIAQSGELAKQYDLTKTHENQILVLKEQEKVLQWQRYSFLILLISFVIVIWLSYMRHKSQEKQNKILREKNEAIAIKNEVLQQSNRDLEQFAFIASHDLKTPLRTIGSYTNLLERRYKHLFDEDAKTFFKFITGAVHSMHQLLTDVLAYAKIDHKQKEITPVDMKKVVDTVYQTLQRKEGTKPIKLMITNPLPVIKANKTHMLQLMQNFMGNAVKFTKADTVYIAIDYVSTPTTHLFSITDKGIGIDPAYQEKIFQIFQRLHNAHEYEGTGIGLSICKKIIEHYRGNIKVNSQLGEGSTFYFTLPVNPETMHDNYTETRDAILMHV